MLATSEQYGAMLAAASVDGYALPAVNVTSSETLNGAMRGFAEAGSDGIVQITTGAADFLPPRLEAAGRVGARAPRRRRRRALRRRRKEPAQLRLRYWRTARTRR